MKRSFQYLSLLLCVLLSATFMAACKNNQGGGDDPIAVESVTVSGESTVLVNTEETYTAIVNPSDATDKTVTWSITGTNSIGATISSEGVFKATTDGSVTIRATAGGKHGDKTITVEEEEQPPLTMTDYFQAVRFRDYILRTEQPSLDPSWLTYDDPYELHHTEVTNNPYLVRKTSNTAGLVLTELMNTEAQMRAYYEYLFRPSTNILGKRITSVSFTVILEQAADMELLFRVAARGQVSSVRADVVNGVAQVSIELGASSVPAGAHYPSSLSDGNLGTETNWLSIRLDNIGELGKVFYKIQNLVIEVE